MNGRSSTFARPRINRKIRRGWQEQKGRPGIELRFHHQRSRVSADFFGASLVTGGKSLRSAKYCSSLRLARSLASAKTFSSCFFSFFQKSFIFPGPAASATIVAHSHHAGCRIRRPNGWLATLARLTTEATPPFLSSQNLAGDSTNCNKCRYL